MRCCILLHLLHQGNEATLNFCLTNFTDLLALITAIRNIQYLGGNTNTTGGLRFIRQVCFSRKCGDRSDVPNVAILITDGIPTREVDRLPGEVATIKSLGIRVIGVGVTNQVRYDTIRYDTIRYDSVYLTCSKRLTSSQFSLPHGINEKLKCENKNNNDEHDQSRCREAVQ